MSGGASNASETGGLGAGGAQASGGSTTTGGSGPASGTSTDTGGRTSAGGSSPTGGGVSTGGAEVLPHGGSAAGGPQAGRDPLGGGWGLAAGNFSDAGSTPSQHTASGGSGGTPTTQGGAGAMAGFAGGSEPDDEDWLSEILVPDSGVLLGLYYGDESIARTGEKIGRVPPLHLTYYAFEDDWTYGPTLDDLRDGRIPFVNWELYGTDLSDIIAGDYDAMLAERAAAVAELGARFFVDFGAEMNGEWSPWGGAQNGQTAEIYLAAYRHVHDAMVAGGATNLIWAWCPNVTDEPRTAWNAAMNYYPGDDYVDWTCVDGYNWGGQSFAEVFRDIYPTLASVGKPIMIGEMSCTEDDDKGPWIDAIVPALSAEFPLIRGLIWFDIDKEEDWRISSSPDAEAAFARMAMDPYMNP